MIFTSKDIIKKLHKFIKSLENPPLLVITSAYDEFAIETYELDVLDYLVKPVVQERLAETVLRLRERLGAAQEAPDIDMLLDKLEARLQKKAAPEPLRWMICFFLILSAIRCSPEPSICVKLVALIRS